jgi:hypothetical protein
MKIEKKHLILNNFKNFFLVSFFFSFFYESLFSKKFFFLLIFLENLNKIKKKKKFYHKIYEILKKKVKIKFLFLILNINTNIFFNIYFVKKKKFHYLTNSIIYFKIHDRKIQKKINSKISKIIKIDFISNFFSNRFPFFKTKILLKTLILKKNFKNLKKKTKYQQITIENIVKFNDLKFFYFSLNFFSDIRFFKIKKKKINPLKFEKNFFLYFYCLKINTFQSSFFLFIYYFLFTIKIEGDVSTILLLKDLLKLQKFLRQKFLEKIIFFDEYFLQKLSIKINIFLLNNFSFLKTFILEIFYNKQAESLIFLMAKKKAKFFISLASDRYKRRLVKNFKRWCMIFRKIKTIFLNIFLRDLIKNLSKNNKYKFKTRKLIKKSFFLFKSEFYKLAVGPILSKRISIYLCANFLIKFISFSILIKQYIVLHSEGKNLQKLFFLYENFFFKLDKKFFLKIEKKQIFIFLSFILIGLLKIRLKPLQIYFKNIEKNFLEILFFKEIFILNHFFLSNENLLNLSNTIKIFFKVKSENFPIKKTKIYKNCMVTKKKCNYFFKKKKELKKKNFVIAILLFLFS